MGSRIHWLGDLDKALREFFDITDPVLDLAMFEELPGRLDRNGITVDDVRDDLQAGVYGIAPRTSSTPDRPTYRLQTHRFDLRIHRERYPPTGTEILVLDNAYPRQARLTDTQVATRPARVVLHPPRSTPPCDIDRLIEALHDRQQVVEAERTLTTVRLDPRRHTQLRDQALRRFGSLRAMLELAEAQARFASEPQWGTVVASPAPDRIMVRFDEPVMAADPEVVPSVGVHPHGDPAAGLTLRIVDIDDEIVVFERPTRARDREKVRTLAVPGVRVAVSGSDQFRYRPHLYAVRTFLRRQGVNNWTALATLLCEPENLAHRAAPDEPDATAFPLNDEQRSAVAGVVGAPHAFLVQGPPGTGKTEVIAESIRRLVARGERVLLTAPTHVALDEVLRRVADEPGVMPVRLHWNDNKVEEGLRRFTRSGYESTIVGSIRTPATSRLGSWQDEYAGYAARLHALDGWQAAVRDRDAARGALAEAQRVSGLRAAERGEVIRRHDTALAQAGQYLQHRLMEVQRLDSRLAEVRSRLASLRRSRGWLGRLADSLGVGAVVRLSHAEQRLVLARAAAGGAYRDAYDRYHQRLAERERALAAATEQDREDAALVDAALACWQDFDRRAAAAAEGLAVLGLDHVRHDAAAAAGTRQTLAAAADRVKALIDVQQAWFDLVGLTGEPNADEVANARSRVGRMLAGSANLVCSTTVGFGGAPTFRDLDYDTLIVDEASKVTVGEFLIPAVRARRWVLVGDEHQLPPYVDGSLERHLHAMSAIHLTERETTVDLRTAVEQLAVLWREFDDDDLHPFRKDSVERAARALVESGAWVVTHRELYRAAIERIAAREASPEAGLLAAMHDHLVTSLFGRCARLIPTNGGPRARLVMQRRMTPQIAELVKDPVYAGAYLSPPEDDAHLPRPLLTPTFRRPVVFFDTSAQVRPWDELTPHGSSFINALEADWVVGLCWQLNHDLHNLDVEERTSVSVLAFYAAQARLIRHRLGHPGYPEFSKLEFEVVDAIDKIQGQESDVVIVSFCRTFGRPRDPTRAHAPRQRSKRAPAPGPVYARWLQSLNHLNVACTRARRLLILVGHRETLRHLGTRPDGPPSPASRFYQNLFNQPDTVLDINIDFVPRPAAEYR